MDYKILLFTALAFAAVFGGFSIIFYFGEWDRLAIVSVMGLFFGALFAPEIEPKKFKRGWLLQIVAGSIAGAMVGFLFSLSVDLIFCCSIIGGFLQFQVARSGDTGEPTLGWFAGAPRPIMHCCFLFSTSRTRRIENSNARALRPVSPLTVLLDGPALFYAFSCEC